MLLAKKIFSQILILIVVGYSGGINIAKHLCDGDVVAKALNSEVKICKKAEESKTPRTNDPSFSEQSCCDTEFSFFQSDDFSQDEVSIDFSIEMFSHEYSDELPEIVSDIPSYSDYSPPPLISEPIYVVHEQYLI